MKTAILFSLILILTACGQKGALYLPEKPTTVHTTDISPVADDDPNDY
ncbi:MAG: lipoprotein [Moraxella sp.]|nr:lipoprotein [Moraxella sp.]